MTEPTWLSPAEVEELQAIAIEKDGGLTGGLVKPGLLASALARPQNDFAYAGEGNLFALAAAYAEAIAHNHAFADANKRTAFMAADVFLYLNGIELRPAKGSEHADMMVALAQGLLSRDAAAAHLAAHSEPVG